MATGAMDKEARMLHEAIHKLAQSIVQGRVHHPEGNIAEIQPNTWFNVEMQEIYQVKSTVQDTINWYGIPMDPIDVKVDIHLTAARLHDHILLERWNIKFQPSLSETEKSEKTDIGLLYSKFSVLARCLQCRLLLLPAQELVSAYNSECENSESPFALYYTIYGESKDAALFDSKASNYIFRPIQTSVGTLVVSVFYRSNANFEFARTRPVNINPHLITNYIPDVGNNRNKFRTKSLPIRNNTKKNVRRSSTEYIQINHRTPPGRGGSSSLIPKKNLSDPRAESPIAQLAFGDYNKKIGDYNKKMNSTSSSRKSGSSRAWDPASGPIVKRSPNKSAMTILHPSKFPIGLSPSFTATDSPSTIPSFSLDNSLNAKRTPPLQGLSLAFVEPINFLNSSSSSKYQINLNENVPPLNFSFNHNSKSNSIHTAPNEIQQLSRSFRIVPPKPKSSSQIDFENLVKRIRKTQTASGPLDTMSMGSETPQSPDVDFFSDDIDDTNDSFFELPHGTTSNADAESELGSFVRDINSPLRLEMFNRQPVGFSELEQDLHRLQEKQIKLMDIVSTKMFRPRNLKDTFI